MGFRIICESSDSVCKVFCLCTFFWGEERFITFFTFKDVYNSKVVVDIKANLGPFVLER